MPGDTPDLERFPHSFGESIDQPREGNRDVAGTDQVNWFIGSTMESWMGREWTRVSSLTEFFGFNSRHYSLFTS